MARERCSVCRRRIRRADEDTAQYWFGQAGDDGMARLMVTHQGCEEEVTPDMRASVREKALLVANTLVRARRDRSEEAKAALMIVAVGMGGGEELFDTFQEAIEVEDDNEFVEQIDHMLSMAGFEIDPY